MQGDKLGYRQVNNATLVVKPSPAGLFGIVAVSAGTVTAYDNASAAAGVVLFTKVLAAGEVVHFGGNGISANNGITVEATGAANILYT